MVDQPARTLDTYRRDAGLSYDDLWLRYFELGGMSSAFQLEACLHGALLLSPQEHDVLVHAINERFVELGDNHPVPYAHDLDDDGLEP